MIKDFARAIRAQLREELENRKTDLEGGLVSDYAEYKRLAGYIQGLKFASNLVEDLANRAETDDDD